MNLTGEDQTIVVEVEASKVVMEDSTLFVMQVPAASAEGEFELEPIYRVMICLFSVRQNPLRSLD